MVHIQVTGIHLIGGNGHEHISELRWEIPGVPNSGGVFTRQEMVDWLNANPWNTAFVQVGNYTVDVYVVKATPPYVKTFRDSTPTDNLLHLPQDW